MEQLPRRSIRRALYERLRLVILLVRCTTKVSIMAKVWQVQEAKAHFSEFLAASVAEGPQIVTKRGVQAAVLVPIDEWRRLKEAARPSLKDVLLAPDARTDALTPARGSHRLRSAPALE